MTSILMYEYILKGIKENKENLESWASLLKLTNAEYFFGEE